MNFGQSSSRNSQNIKENDIDNYFENNDLTNIESSCTSSVDPNFNNIKSYKKNKSSEESLRFENSRDCSLEEIINNIGKKIEELTDKDISIFKENKVSRDFEKKDQANLNKNNSIKVTNSNQSLDQQSTNFQSEKNEYQFQNKINNNYDDIGSSNQFKKKNFTSNNNTNCKYSERNSNVNNAYDKFNYITNINNNNNVYNNNVNNINYFTNGQIGNPINQIYNNNYFINQQNVQTNSNQYLFKQVPMNSNNINGINNIVGMNYMNFYQNNINQPFSNQYYNQTAFNSQNTIFEKSKNEFQNPQMAKTFKVAKTFKNLKLLTNDSIIHLHSDEIIDKNFKLDMITNASIYAFEQIGCRYLEHLIQKDTSSIGEIFISLKPFIYKICINQYGNYLIQKLLDLSSLILYKEIVDEILINLNEIGTDSHGTRVIQKIVEIQKTKDLGLEKLAKAMTPVLLSFMIDNNAYHIIVKIIKTFNDSDYRFVYKCIKKNFLETSININGCCIVQKIIVLCKEKQQQKLVNLAVENLFILINDPVGNHLINLILSLQISSYSVKIMEAMINVGLIKLLRGNISISVIEKCIDRQDFEEKLILISRLLKIDILKELISTSNGIFSKFLI